MSETMNLPQAAAHYAQHATPFILKQFKTVGSVKYSHGIIMLNANSLQQNDEVLEILGSH